MEKRPDIQGKETCNKWKRDLFWEEKRPVLGGKETSKRNAVPSTDRLFVLFVLRMCPTKRPLFLTKKKCPKKKPRLQAITCSSSASYTRLKYTKLNYKELN